MPLQTDLTSKTQNMQRLSVEPSNHRQSHPSSPYASRHSQKHKHQMGNRKREESPSTSQSSESRFLPQSRQQWPLRAVYQSQPQAKYLALMLIQDLVRICRYDIYTYCLMLQMLANLTFQGYSQISIKIAITVFHLGSKFFNSNRPRLWQLVVWSQYLVTAPQIIHCQEQIYKGFNYCLPVHEDLGLDEVQALCFEIEQSIFNLTQPF